MPPCFSQHSPGPLQPHPLAPESTTLWELGLASSHGAVEGQKDRENRKSLEEQARLESKAGTLLPRYRFPALIFVDPTIWGCCFLDSYKTFVILLKKIV